MLRRLALVALWILAPLSLGPASAEVPAIRPHAQIGPWPVVSQLAAFQGRLWFANSVKGVNHNSADLYSLSMTDLEVRFERSLFSQDAGDPVVAGGWLYWPLEDSRNSVGWAEVTVTNGRDWRRLAIPGAQAFHNHAMTVWRGRLLAATSAWRAGFHVSADGGQSWREVYDHPTPDRRVSRVVKLAAAESFFLGHLIDVGRNRLLLGDAQGVSVLEAWPAERRVVAMAAAEDAIYLAANQPDGMGLWRSDGDGLDRLEGQLPAGQVQDLRWAAGRLWLLAAESGEGFVWSSSDGADWRQELHLLDGTPWELLVERGSLYVGGTSNSGLGAIWIHQAAVSPPAEQELEVSAWVEAPQPDQDWDEAAAHLDRLLEAPQSYRSRATLRDEIHRLAIAGPPDGFFAQRLSRGRSPAGAVPLIGGRVQVRNRDFADWLLLWGMGLSRQQGVPTGFFLQPWVSSANPAEKYFEPLPAALWAVAMGGQADRTTIAALVERMGFAEDPDWLRNHVAGTLATLTGQPKHANQDRWLDWWAAAEPSWPG